MDTYIQIDGPYTGMTDIISYRETTNPWGLHIAKLIAFGYDCTELPQFERWTRPAWTKPATYSFTAFG